MGNRELCCNPGCRTSVLSERRPRLRELMFWKRSHEQSSAVDELRDSLSDRLRLVFDFATLGAYEDESDEQPAAPTDQAAELSAALRRRAERAESSKNAARVPHRPVPQPHTQASPSPCDRAPTGGACSASQSAAIATLARRQALATGRRLRPGGVPAPQQPCTWTGS
jgi:hypothetical protein